jgi:hypothetical protein
MICGEEGRADASYNNNCSTSCPKERKQAVLNANNPFSDSGKYFFEYDALALGEEGVGVSKIASQLPLVDKC